MILQTSKNHIVLWKKTYKLPEKTQMILKNYTQISQKGEKKGLLGMWVFPVKI